MKQKNSKIKICIIIALIVIVIGIIMTVAKGMNKTMLYSNHTRLEIILNDLEKQRVEDIAKEVLGNDIIIQTFGDFEDSIAISIRSLEEEKITDFQNRINELNGGEEVTITQTQVGKIKMIDVIMPYILPIALVTGIFAIYRGIKCRKENFIKNLIIPIITVAIVFIIYFSIFAIFSIPVGYYFMPLGTTIGIITLIILAICSNKKKSEN